MTPLETIQNDAHAIRLLARDAMAYSETVEKCASANGIDIIGVGHLTRISTAMSRHCNSISDAVKKAREEAA